MSYDPFISLTRATSNFLAVGPLKIPSVMSELLGRPIEPRKEPVYLSGCELVTVNNEETGMPQFTLHPVDYGEVTLAQYHDLTPYELELINRFCKVGEVNVARLDITGFGGHTEHFLVHHIREGVPFVVFDFGPSTEIRRAAIYSEAELNKAINPNIDEYRAMARQMSEAPNLPPLSRK